LTLIIRQMNKDDISSVQEIAQISWSVTYEGLIPKQIQERFLQSAYSEDCLQVRLHKSLFFIAQIGETIVGFANFSHVNDRQAELLAIYLDPAYQQMGIGSALLENGIQQLQGAASLTVCVEKDNSIGRQFYMAKGFQQVEEFDDIFDGHILKTIRLELALN